jgi:hypothetical protein
LSILISSRSCRAKSGSAFVVGFGITLVAMSFLA